MRHSLISTSHPIRRYHDNMNRILTALVLGLSLLFASGGIVFAQDYQKGFEAAGRGDFATALREFSVLAEQGDSDAQHNLGLMYERGQGVTQDYKEAVKWYRKSAKKGNTHAQNNLGLMYEQGKGVTQDDKEAVKWYRKSAEQGNAKAQTNLGVMYFAGAGILQDIVYAHMWMNIAASTGDADAAANIDIIAKRITVIALEKAQALARECVKKNYKGC